MGVLKISPACLAAGVGFPVSVACRSLFVGGRVEADVSVPCVDAAAPDVGCVLPGEGSHSGMALAIVIAKCRAHYTCSKDHPLQVCLEPLREPIPCAM